MVTPISVPLAADSTQTAIDNNPPTPSLCFDAPRSTKTWFTSNQSRSVLTASNSLSSDLCFLLA